nr:hypothetical protein GCM10025699_12620 [Microbacterium flavescens]
MGDHLDAGNERRRIAEVHAQEALRCRDGLGEGGDGDRGRVAADERLRRRILADAPQRLVLDGEHLRHGLLDEVDRADGLFDGSGGRDPARDRVAGVDGEDPSLGVVGRLADDPLPVRAGELSAHVREDDIPSGEGEHLRDAASHVPRSDDRDLRDHRSSSSRSISSTFSAEGDAGSKR